MYRAITLACLENNCLENKKKIIQLLENIYIDFKINDETGQSETYLNNRNIDRCYAKNIG